MQRLFSRAGLGHQGQFGSVQEQAQVIVGGRQPAAWGDLELVEAAGRPEILHGGNRRTLRRQVIRYELNSCLCPWNKGWKGIFHVKSAHKPGRRRCFSLCVQ